MVSTPAAKAKKTSSMRQFRPVVAATRFQISVLPNNGNPTYGRTTNARDIVWRIGHDRGSGGAPEAWKTYKNQNPAI